MEIYDELSFEDCKNEDFRLNLSPESGGMLRNDPSSSSIHSTFVLLSESRQKLFVCSSLYAPEVRIISSCQFNSGRILYTEYCQIGEQPFILALLGDELGNVTGSSESCDRSIWIIDLYSGRAWKTLFLIPNNFSAFHVASSSNSDGICYFALGRENQFFIGSIGISSVSSSGSVEFSFSELEFVDLSTLNSKKITSIYLYQKPNSENCFLFLGTDSGAIEIWRKGNQSIDFMTKMSCPGAVTRIVYSQKNLNNDIGVIFASHKRNQSNDLIISAFTIDYFTIAAKDVRISWARGGKNRLVKFNVSLDSEGFNVASVYSNEDRSYSVDIYSFPSNVKTNEVSVTEKILDAIPHCGSLGNTTILTTLRVARYVNVERIHQDSFEDVYSLRPNFENWFSRDSASFLYKNQKSSAILSMRSKLDNELFFDKLLGLCGIEKAKYPPKDSHEFESLFHLILNNQNQGMTLKHCLIYYFLKDSSALKSSKYADYYGITRPFLLAIDGFWAMDNGHFKDAIQYLSDPCVDLDDSAEVCLEWSKKILCSLYINSEFQLASIFINNTTPPVWSQSSITQVLEVLAKSNLIESLQFCRKFCRHNLESSLRIIFQECVSSGSKDKSNALLSAPFTKEEEDFLVKFLKKSVKTSDHDFLLNFLIQRGRYAESLQIYQDLFVNRGKQSPKRQNLMKNLALLLPRVQLLALGLVVPSYVAPTSESNEMEVAAPEILSQSNVIQSAPKSDRTVLQALQNNYLTQAAYHSIEPDAQEGTQHISEIQSTPFKISKANDTQLDNSLSKSPAVSPFIQQPFTSNPSSRNSPIVKPPVTGRISIGRKSLGDYSIMPATNSAKTPSVPYSATPLSAKISLSETPSSIQKTLCQSLSSVEKLKPKTPTPVPAKEHFKQAEKIATPLLSNRGQISTLQIQSVIDSQPANSKIVTISNLSASPLVSAAPPLVNRSPFVSKTFNPVQQISDLVYDAVINPAKNDPVENIETGDFMDEDVPPPPQTSLMYLSGPREALQDQITESQPSSAQSSPDSGKQKSTVKRRGKREIQKTSPRKKNAMVTESGISSTRKSVRKPSPLEIPEVVIGRTSRRKPNGSEVVTTATNASESEKSKTLTSLNVSLKNEERLFSPRKLRSTRKKSESLMESSAIEAATPIPATSNKKSKAQTTGRKTGLAEPALKTPMVNMRSKRDEVATRSLRPRK